LRLYWIIIIFDNIHDNQHLQELDWGRSQRIGWIMEDEAPKTLSVPQAGRRYFELGKNASYEAARRGDLPVIRIGGRLRVPVVALERMLEAFGEGKRRNDSGRD
jgi:hypothetical protein